MSIIGLKIGAKLRISLQLTICAPQFFYIVETQRLANQFPFHFF